MILVQIFLFSSLLTFGNLEIDFGINLTNNSDKLLILSELRFFIKILTNCETNLKDVVTPGRLSEMYL